MLNQLYYSSLSKDKAEKVALDALHLDGIKYIYGDHKNYLKFYNQYNHTYALDIAKKLKDLKAIRYICRKNSVDYLAYLYKDTPQNNLNTARDFNDLKGFKHIFQSLGISYLNILYSINCTSEKIETEIKTNLYYAAVLLKDSNGVSYILNTTQTHCNTTLVNVLQNDTSIIRDTYYKEHIDIAYKLIAAGAAFDVPYIIKPVHNLQLNHTQYSNHINILRKGNYISIAEHQRAIRVLAMLYKNPVVKLDSKNLGYGIRTILANSTYTDGNLSTAFYRLYEALSRLLNIVLNFYKILYFRHYAARETN